MKYYNRKKHTNICVNNFMDLPIHWLYAMIAQVTGKVPYVLQALIDLEKIPGCAIQTR